MRVILIGLALFGLAFVAAPVASADHGIFCVDDPICYATCKAGRTLEFLRGEGDVQTCTLAWS